MTKHEEFIARFEYLKSLGEGGWIDLLAPLEPRSCIIISGGVLDDMLTAAILCKMRADFDEYETLFERDGAVSRFSSKITMARGLGITTKEMTHDLGIIKKLRNDCAHSYLPISFERDPFRARARSLTCGGQLKLGSLDGIASNSQKRFVECVVALTLLLLIASLRGKLEKAGLWKDRKEIEAALREFGWNAPDTTPGHEHGPED